MASGVRCAPRVREGVLDRFTRGLVTDMDISLILVGKESGFGGRLVDMERVREVVMSAFGISAFVLSLDLARSRGFRFGATDFDGSVLDRLTVGGLDLERVLDVDSLERLGDLFATSFMATFFLPWRTVGPFVMDDDSLPPSLA